MPTASLPFMVSLNLLDLAILTNDPMRHDATWPPMPTKLQSDIQKIEGKVGEDPQNHIMSFHLWCSSNSIVDDSIRLFLFHRTFTRVAANWYFEQPSGIHPNYVSLASNFITFFQIHVHYDEGVKILALLFSSKSFAPCPMRTSTYGPSLTNNKILFRHGLYHLAFVSHAYLYTLFHGCRFPLAFLS